MKNTLALIPLIVCFSLLTGYNFMSAQWSAPTATPPGNNTAAPVNVGATTQAKSGNLAVNIFAATTEMRSTRYCNGLGLNCLTNSTGTWTTDSGFTVLGTTTATAFMYSSDVRLKHDISRIDDPLAVIEQLRGVSFLWNRDNNHTYGLIAQEVEQVLPELVATDADGYKSVAYGNLIPFLIEAIKVQQSEIDELKKESKSE